VAASGDIEVEPKIARLLPEDTVVTLDIPGGGGFGSPLKRDPAQVLVDVRDGYVSIEAARADYAVVIDPDAWTVDEAATERLRAERASHAAE